MSTVLWNDALQGVTPTTGGQPLPPATYRFRPIAGEGKDNSGGAPMLSLQLEVISGPMAGRKHYHYENLPKGNSDADKQRMGYFLGLCQAFGITGEMLGQWFQGQPVSKETLEYLAKYIVQSGRVVKATLRPRRNDEARVDASGWVPDDGIEPEPPKQAAVAAPMPGAPESFGPPQTPNSFAGGPQAPSGLPLGGFPGSVQQGGAPSAAPDWATQQQVQGQAPQQITGPGQAAPAAQPQAAGMSQFQQLAAAQFPQSGQASAPQQDAFPGQQFPGQVNPANFPATAQPNPGQQMPGMPQAAPQQNSAPTGQPQGGFPLIGGQPPQANI